MLTFPRRNKYEDAIRAAIETAHMPGDESVSDRVAVCVVMLVVNNVLCICEGDFGSRELEKKRLAGLGCEGYLSRTTLNDPTPGLVRGESSSRGSTRKDHSRRDNKTVDPPRDLSHRRASQSSPKARRGHCHGVGARMSHSSLWRNHHDNIVRRERIASHMR